MRDGPAGPTVLLATRNAGKLKEVGSLFAGRGWRLRSLDDVGLAEDPVAEDAIEASETFEGNALAKARWFHARSGLAVVAEDSGLEVHALGGAPGVRSRRWLGNTGLHGVALDHANVRALLARLSGVADRSATFVCAAAFVDAGREAIARGVVHGQIAHEPLGDSGFGYDPVFVAEEGGGLPFAAMDPSAKAGISHRTRAFTALMDRIARWLERD